jgi:hypothetical protein
MGPRFRGDDSKKLKGKAPEPYSRSISALAAAGARTFAPAIM